MVSVWCKHTLTGFKHTLVQQQYPVKGKMDIGVTGFRVSNFKLQNPGFGGELKFGCELHQNEQTNDKRRQKGGGIPKSWKIEICTKLPWLCKWEHISTGNSYLETIFLERHTN